MPNWKKVVVSGSDALLNTVTTTGDITAGGDIIANNYIINSSVTNVTQSFSSGSTIFGDTNNDTHQFTGSISILHTGSNYGLELSGSSVFIDAGSSGSLTLGTHNIGIDIASIIPITGSGLIVSQSNLPANHYNMIKVGDVELVDYNNPVLSNEAFLIDVKHDRAIVISSSNTNNALAQFKAGEHKFYGSDGSELLAQFGDSLISLQGAANVYVLAENNFQLRAGTNLGTEGNLNYILGSTSNPTNVGGALHVGFSTSNILQEFGGAVTASAVSSSGLLFASLSEDTAGSYNNAVVYDTATGQFYYTGSYGSGGSGGGNAWTTIKLGDGTTYTDLTATSTTEILKINTGSNIEISSITDGSGTDEFTIQAIPSPSDTYVQYNSASVFNGHIGLRYSAEEQSFRSGDSNPSNANAPNAEFGLYSGSHILANNEQLVTNAKYIDHGHFFSLIGFYDSKDGVSDPGGGNQGTIGTGTSIAKYSDVGANLAVPTMLDVSFIENAGQAGIETPNHSLQNDLINGSLRIGGPYVYYDETKGFEVHANYFETPPGSPATVMGADGFVIFPSASVVYNTSGSRITPIASASGRITINENLVSPADSTFNIIGRKNTQFQTGESGSEENYLMYENTTDTVGIGKGITEAIVKDVNTAKLLFISGGLSITGSADTDTINITQKGGLSYTPTIRGTGEIGYPRMYGLSILGSKDSTPAFFNDKIQITTGYYFEFGGRGRDGGDASSRAFVVESDEVEIGTRVNNGPVESPKSGIRFTANPSIEFYNNDASSSISGAFVPTSASAQIKFDTASSSINFFAGDTTTDLVEVMHISRSGVNPRIGIGTDNPLRAFDFKEVRDDNKGGEIIIRGSRTTKGAEINDEVGRINFVIDSSSFEKIDLSGSAAEIVATVDDIDNTGVRGSLSLRASAQKSEDSTERIKIIGDPTQPYQILFTGSAEFDSDVNFKSTITSDSTIEGTSITASAGFKGDIVGNVTGDVTGTATSARILSGSNLASTPKIHCAEQVTYEADNQILIIDNDADPGHVKRIDINGLPYARIADGVVPSDSKLVMFTGSSGTSEVAMATGIGYSAILGWQFSNAGTTYDLFAGNSLVTNFTASTGSFLGDVTVSGDLTVDGNITANQYIVSSSVTYMTQSFSSGSTIFGDTIDDTHLFTGSVDITGSLIVDGMTYPTTDGNDGQVLLTDGSGALTFGDVKVYAQVKNISGVTLTKGTPVHATASASPPAGNVSEVIAASASLASSMPATFVLDEELAHEAEGRAILSGFINGVDTSAFKEGDVVYVGENGGYTTTKPTGTNLIQNLGIITKVDASNGAGYIYGSGRSNDVPNIAEGYAWVGNNSGVATATTTSSFVVTTANTASYVSGSNVDGAVALATNALTAINSTNAANIDINNVSLNSEYGLVFRDGNGDGNQALYADNEADQPSYNPSTNTIKTPIISASSALYVSGNITVEEGDITTNTIETISTIIASDSATNVDTFATSTYTGAIYDYILTDTTVGARAGQFMIAQDNGSVTYTDNSTRHLFDATAPEITAQINGANVEIQVTNGNGYTFKSFVKKL